MSHSITHRPQADALPCSGVHFVQRMAAEGRLGINPMFFRVIAVPKEVAPEDIFRDETKFAWHAWFDDELKAQEFFEIIRSPDRPMPAHVWDYPLKPFAPLPDDADVWWAYTFATAYNSPNNSLTAVNLPASWGASNRIDIMSGAGGAGGCEVGPTGGPGCGGGGGGGCWADLINTGAFTSNQSTDYFIGGGGAGGAGAGVFLPGGGGSAGGGGSSGDGGGGSGGGGGD